MPNQQMNEVDFELDQIKKGLCTCGSGEPREAIYDARGIFVTYACDRCRKEKLKGYRKDIFTDANYECDEEIDDPC